MKQLFTLFILFAFLALIPGAVPVFAKTEAEGAAQLSIHAETQDSRADQLEAYLAAHQSPVTDQASHFVAEADRLGLDWKLVPAILGVESTFGRFIPTGSYNGWGWGIFTGAQDGVHFKNWADGITQVSEGLRHNYVDRGAQSIEQIGRIYAASPRWAGNIRFFMSQIEGFIPTNPDQLKVVI